MDTTIRAQIMALADEKYRQFSASLIPNINNVVGVRLPGLRKLARNIAKGDWRAYLAQADSDYFEEVMLQGMVIGCAKADVEEILHHIAAFVPKIDNWSVCDSFCSGLKITSLHKERVWEFIQPYLESDKEYDIRFGVVMLLNYYVDELYIHRVLERLDRITHEGYYVKMAVAWAVSICFVKLPDITMDYLRSNSLDDFTYNKALQKITESYRVAPETKALIRSMKRK
ncbi:DNA alkylation repair protein [Paenibacillus thiaminolyticus]|uniref:DNA alkylation repair protein n=1 Tax=Paenibacillus thiaminolyticus TaxID=49283 RepID=UPI00234FE882|nr:DNA alkylation repair protein [Paenibacillus thiaminolyticus]WCR28566.1 DNA alkylation repair protein [Paenibacillus thiaminolyticus]